MPTSFAALIAAHGAPAVFLLILAGAAPSEIVLPMAGAVVAPSPLGLAAVTAAGVAAHQASAIFWYAAGRRLGHRRCRRWVVAHGTRFGLPVREFDRSVAWFRRRGARAVLLSRALPVARALVCLPAGAARLALGRFLAASLIGSTAWCSLLTTVGVVLAARAPGAVVWLNRAAWAILLFAIALALVRHACRRKRLGRRSRPGTSPRR